MMNSVPPRIQPAMSAHVAPQQAGCRQLYFAMLDECSGSIGQIDDLVSVTSRSFLQQQLKQAAAIDSDFPDDMRLLPQMLRASHDQVAQDYRCYLDERDAGAPRRYFSCRSHAMYFLRTVAATKLVDGAWLYGLLQRWQDPRLAPLIRTYIEELGCGNAQQNHVLLYKRLLARYGCDTWQDGPDEHFTQGAIQLALAHHAHDFLPELIGFNLGYEQLPLHLLITAYELNELDIDPYYFILHVSSDNISTGHGRKALQSVFDCKPSLSNSRDYHRRVGNGYRLNLVGMGTHQAIAAFDLEQELQRVFTDKAQIGAKLHSDYCLIAGQSVSEWLSSGDLGSMLTVLQASGWIRRGENPKHSRFWRLLTDDQAPMFGVFDGYEQQLLQDWIRNDSGGKSAARTTNSFRRRPSAGYVDGVASMLPGGASIEQIIAHHVNSQRALAACAGGERPADNCAEVTALFQQLTGVDTKAQAFALLAGLLSPANHPTPAGLVATRLYADIFSR